VYYLAFAEWPSQRGSSGGIPPGYAPGAGTGPGPTPT
jgi:hypothetical protein